MFKYTVIIIHIGVRVKPNNIPWKSFRMAPPLFHSIWTNIVSYLPQLDNPFCKNLWKSGGVIRKVIRVLFYRINTIYNSTQNAYICICLGPPAPLLLIHYIYKNKQWTHAVNNFISQCAIFTALSMSFNTSHVQVLFDSGKKTSVFARIDRNV